jgi:NAD-dependent deacetylase
MLESIVILTGAGISAESGIKTFRASDGLWENHRIEDVATPEAFARNPALVHKFYNDRRKQLKDPSVQPNAAHQALARLEQEWEGEVLLVTQNVDDLHERAGSKKVLHMHGALNKIRCLDCEATFDWAEDLSTNHKCERCSTQGTLRPDIVWFGEIPYYMDVILESLNRCKHFISIGTSGKVYPAAGFASQAMKAFRYEVNLENSDISSNFQEHRRGLASVEVPKLVDEILGTALRG